MGIYQFDDAARRMLENMCVPLAVYQFVDKRVIPLVLSDGFCRLFEFDSREEAYSMMNRDMYETTHPDDTARVANEAFRFAIEDGKYEMLYRTRTMKCMDYKIVHAFGEHVYTEDGVRLAYVWYSDEGTYTKEEDNGEDAYGKALSQALRKESILNANFFDYLTGLPSMSYFFELADAWRKTRLSSDSMMAVLYMDLCGMKYYNRKYGFAEGDRLLQSFGNILKKYFSSNHCSRFGSDHFCVFSEAERLEERLEELFSEIRSESGQKMLGVRVGICLDNCGLPDISAICDRAKYACDTMRNSFVSRYCYFEDNMLEKAEITRYIVSHIDQAIREHWIEVYYQPIVRAANGRVCDEEALARWIDPVRGLISPAEFIPILEEAKLIYKLDLYVVEKVLEKMKNQRDSGLYVVPGSVNLSRADFDCCDIVEEIRCRVDASEFGRDMLTIEVTESTVGNDFGFMKNQIERFQRLGFHVWMDDFGSGYSALDVLQSIRFDLIKFDMRFMKEFSNSDKCRIMLTELMRMAIALGSDTVCEGVETEEQVDFLRDIGCTKMQGFYFCRPIPYEEILERYRKEIQIGFENPEESDYYAVLGKINLYDLAIFANDDQEAFESYFNTLPMAILEADSESFRLVRCNNSYRSFLKQTFAVDLTGQSARYTEQDGSFGPAFTRALLECGENGNKLLLDEKLANGSLVHTFMKRVAINPIKGTRAIAVVILGVMDGKNAPMTYTQVAKALSSDYVGLYYVNLNTERFVEYNYSNPAEAELAVERHGEDFFTTVKHEARSIIAAEDYEKFVSCFTRENIVRSIEKCGSFTLTYRLLIDGAPAYVCLKAVKLENDAVHIIVGVNNIDAQMRQRKTLERMRQEQIAYSRIIALTGNYLCIYTVNPETDYYTEYSSLREYDALNLPKQGENFFEASIRKVAEYLCPEDKDTVAKVWKKENVFRTIRETGVFEMRYRLKIREKLFGVCLRAVLVDEPEGEQLIIGLTCTDSSFLRADAPVLS